ncbi:hypothetical protein M1555_01225 [Patescibacteria group bacterium]|nr:hypothetical protein [Patescibacteria group bacterium]
MNRKFPAAVLSAALFLGFFLFYRSRITGNTVLFFTDEAYWVSTANIVPVLLRGRFSDRFWNEYYGFTNFNGAKFIFGIALRILPHGDPSLAGTAPMTYYRWVPYDGRPFPRGNPFYASLTDARLTSAWFAAGAVAALAVLTYLASGSLWAMVLAGAILGMHPITAYAAEHAFADSFLLFFEVLFLLSLAVPFRTNGNAPEGRYALISGILIGILTAIKLNALLFLPVYGVWTGTAIALSDGGRSPDTWGMRVFRALCTAAAAAGFTFLLLEPNLFFYPGLPLGAMIEGRLRITREHIAYFGRLTPSHVLLTVPARLRSLAGRVFPPWMLVLTLAGAGALTGALLRRSRNIPFLILFLVSGTVTGGIMLSYIVFDEPRYYLPILPFLIAACICAIAAAGKPLPERG